MIPVADIVWSSALLELVTAVQPAMALSVEHNHFGLYNNTTTPNIQGIDRDSANGRPIALTNRGSQRIRYFHLSTSAIAEDRIRCPYGVDFDCEPGETVVVFYNTGDKRWELIGTPSLQANTGATFPADPVDGQLFYRTDLREDFRYDSTNAGWIGQRALTFLFGEDSVSSSSHLRGPGNSAFGGNDRGYLLPDHKYALLSMAAAWSNNVTGSIQARQDNGLKKSVAFTSAEVASDLDFYQLLDQDERLQAYFAINLGTASHVSVWMDVRRVFPDPEEEQGN